MIALERLSPLERAAFLLHDVFGVSFDEIAETIGREPATCRQLASRARTHIRAARPRFPMSKERGLEIAAAFFSASRSGDMQQLRSLLAADVTTYADGGGKTSAATRPIVGFDDVMQFHASLALIFAAKMSRMVRYCFINGLPGFVTIEQDGAPTDRARNRGGKIVAIYVMRNPDKLARRSNPSLKLAPLRGALIGARIGYLFPVFFCFCSALRDQFRNYRRAAASNWLVAWGATFLARR